MAELVVCAVAVAATPPVLFGVEQTERRLRELNSSSCSDPQMHSLQPVPEDSPTFREQTKEETLGDKILSWTDQIDKGASYLDQLVLQRSTELKKAFAGFCGTPKTQTPRISTEYVQKAPSKSLQLGHQSHSKTPQLSGCQSAATLHDILSSPQEESMNPDVWMSMHEGKNQYIFVPARAA